ncbi:hypothetical protein [Streptomyces sp. C8S0]|uniref:hypothetical protein n=1 Tax=Streptomyces sp. C8S0 TaxID=2585716 RepID=UPI00125DADB1|nr:hypothetical protein [Streptomyces sp. C8S0]
MTATSADGRCAERWVVAVPGAYQAAVEKGRKITRELARRGQLAPPLHDDPAAAREELEDRLADAKKRRQQGP